MTQLYERWRAVSAECRSELALHDIAASRAWSFQQLAEEAERNVSETGTIVFPSAGSGALFVMTVLRSWRTARTICPLEAGQEQPHLCCPPNRITHLKSTSATTGDRRFIAFTAEQIAADAENIVTTMGLRRDWPNLGVISPAHSYGFSNLITPLLLHGIPLIFADSALPERMRGILAQYPCLTLPGVPALWRVWHETRALTPSIRLAISAGAPLPLSLEQAVYENTGIKIHNFYGSSECGGIAYDSLEYPRDDETYVGSALKNVRLSVADSGCLRVHSRAVGETYWPQPNPSISEGVFQTGDLAEILDGFVFLRGRASDVINVAGKKVAPQTIEQVLRTHPNVLDCLVFRLPSPDADRNDSIAAAVVVGSPVTETNLRQFLLHRLPSWQVPRFWRFVSELPVNNRGKLSRVAISHALFPG